jgi:tetratricopeptide (TPR) repeat protein
MEDNTYLAPAAYKVFRQRNYPHAIELFLKRIDELSHVENKEKEIFLLKNDAAVCLILNSEPDAALDILQECYNHFKDQAMDSKVAMSLANIATAYESKKDFKTAISYYTQALANFPSFDDNDVKYFIHHNLSLLYMRRFQLNKAILERFHALDYKQHLSLADKLIQFVLRVLR